MWLFHAHRSLSSLSKSIVLIGQLLRPPNPAVTSVNVEAEQLPFGIAARRKDRDAAGRSIKLLTVLRTA